MAQWADPQLIGELEDWRRVNDRVEQQTQRIYENVALLALDLSATSSLSLLARIIAMRIDPGPPFSALSRFGYR